ncbi:MAG: uncharacterized protein A8A55_3257 [Amphiamblys sp. WSBS2006]|nr:MAG: uncharacterized protein A8A55_3257 [Amphiamblys sp. WSBS2006]
MFDLARKSFAKHGDNFFLEETGGVLIVSEALLEKGHEDIQKKREFLYEKRQEVLEVVKQRVMKDKTTRGRESMWRCDEDDTNTDGSRGKPHGEDEKPRGVPTYLKAAKMGQGRKRTHCQKLHGTASRNLEDLRTTSPNTKGSGTLAGWLEIEEDCGCLSVKAAALNSHADCVARCGEEALQRTEMHRCFKCTDSNTKDLDGRTEKTDIPST